MAEYPLRANNRHPLADKIEGQLASNRRRLDGLAAPLTGASAMIVRQNQSAPAAFYGTKRTGMDGLMRPQAAAPDARRDGMKGASREAPLQSLDNVGFGTAFGWRKPP
jgi:hypothetical protein